MENTKLEQPTIHVVTKLALAVNTHYPEYGEEVIGPFSAGALQHWLDEGQWGHHV